VASLAVEDDGHVTIPSKEKTADVAISLGQSLTWKGRRGIVRYIGDVRFAGGG